MKVPKKEALSKVAAQMGSKGGTAGRGRSKKRGNSTYYRDMQRKSVLVRLANAKAKEKESDSKS